MGSYVKKPVGPDLEFDLIVTDFARMQGNLSAQERGMYVSNALVSTFDMNEQQCSQIALFLFLNSDVTPSYLLDLITPNILKAIDHAITSHDVDFIVRVTDELKIHWSHSAPHGFDTPGTSQQRAVFYKDIVSALSVKMHEIDPFEKILFGEIPLIITHLNSRDRAQPLQRVRSTPVFIEL